MFPFRILSTGALKDHGLPFWVVVQLVVGRDILRVHWLMNKFLPFIGEGGGRRSRHQAMHLHVTFEKKREMA